MNEPYQRIHSQEDSNSTLGTYAKHIGFGLATSGLMEAGVYLGAKKVNAEKHPLMSAYLNQAAFNKPEGGGRLNKALNSGLSTKTGRLANYGMSVGTGLLTGTLSTLNKE